MIERGILFTPQNIRLVMSGAKVQTRRVINPQPTVNQFGCVLWTKNRADSQIAAACPYGYCQPSGIHPRVYIKEGLRHGSKNNPTPSLNHVWRYALDNTPVMVEEDDKSAMLVWATHKEGDVCNALFMPKFAARTWLEITEVRVERVQDISEEDAKAEGCSNDTDWEWRPSYGDPDSGGNPTYKRDYQELWNSINGKKHPWEENPWVFALTFRRIE